ncbi:MAG TPA: cytochrome c biogenesis protein CcsA [Acidobacteriaceae bacterium]
MFPTALYDRPMGKSIAVPAAIGAVILHIVALIETLNAAHHLLPVGVHETRSLFGLIFGITFLVVYWRFRTVSIGVFVLPIAFLLAILPAFAQKRQTLGAPLVMSAWIVVHVTLLLTAYAALAVSLIASVLYLLEERRLKRKQPRNHLRWLPPLDTLDQIAAKSLVLGFPCMTIGLMIGSTIAQQRLGTSIFLDPKVLLSYAMWGAYVAMIFIRRYAGLRGRRAVYLSLFFMVCVVAVWSANHFSQVHRFPTP